jgi:hypothetical protein
MLREPVGGPAVQVRYLVRQTTPHLQAEEVSKQGVVAEPGALGIERCHERVGVFQAEQDPFGARAAGHQVGQFSIDAIEQAGAQE